MSDMNKRTESFDKQREGDMDSLSTSRGAVGSSVASGPDLAKRRLVRGAAAAAPMLLTLRSGALAASSCTGILGKNVTVADDGKITLGSGTSPSTYSTATAGDVCFKDTTVTYCSDPLLNNTKVQSVGGGTPATVLNSGGNFYCGGGPGHNGLGGNYAIMSSGAMHSLTGGTGV